MNILFVEGSLPPYKGGVERVTSLLASSFSKIGHNCFFAYYIEDDINISNTKKIKIDIKWGKEQMIKVLNSFVQYNSIEIIINQDIYSKGLRLYYDYFRRHGGKVINCFHMSPDWHSFVNVHYGYKSKLKNYLYRFIFGCGIAEIECRRLFKSVDKFVLLSPSFIKQFCTVYNVSNNNKLVAISNPLTFPKIKPSSIVYNKTNHVLIVARLLDIHKNISGALRIWKRVEEKISGWKLLIVGDGPDKEDLEKYAKELGLNHVEFVGKAINPLRYYETAKVFMMTSNFEGFGMTLTEAMQNGCVTMAFDTYTSLHDIIENGRNGFVIEKEREDLYSKKLIELMNSDNLITNMSHNALQSVSKFSIDNITNQWMDLLKSI